MQESEENIYKEEFSGRKIGVFDSGIGGLTVLKALKRLLPQESYIYVGDTARLPYGTKSRETVIKYSESLARALLQHHPDAVVVACNTASTHALDAVKKLCGDIPVIGMIEPAAKAAVKATKSGQIAVIATAGTIHSGAYTQAIQSLNPEISVSNAACQMLVALAEEGWNDPNDRITRMALERYLTPLFDHPKPPDTLILGCTHFPVFSEMIKDILGESVILINSGEEAALCLHGNLGVLRETNLGKTKFFATDDPERFARNAMRFYDHHLDPHDVELIDIYLYT